ncbi:MAG: PEP-CTERM sorting domain-containing protein [Phycisphaerae bacterium]|nr:PEP-CTERM sorting domain-containing protein [Phycisphaerae bacterium]
MRKQCLGMLLAGAFLLLVGSLTAGAYGDVVYREVFGNDTGSNQDMSYAGWNMYYSSTCKTYNSANPDYWDARINHGTGEDAGNPTDLPAVNSNPANSEMEQGWVYLRYDNTDEPNWLFWTDEVAGLGIAKSDLTEASWYQSDSYWACYRLGLKINGTWYFSGDTYSNNQGWPLATNGMKMTVDYFDAANWYTGYVEPGVIMDRDTDPNQLTSLPEGTIQAVGLYAGGAAQASGIRFDTLEIQAVPEPATMGLLAVGGLALLKRRNAQV